MNSIECLTNWSDKLEAQKHLDIVSELNQLWCSGHRNTYKILIESLHQDILRYYPSAAVSNNCKFDFYPQNRGVQRNSLQIIKAYGSMYTTNPDCTSLLYYCMDYCKKEDKNSPFYHSQYVKLFKSNRTGNHSLASSSTSYTVSQNGSMILLSAFFYSNQSFNSLIEQISIEDSLYLQTIPYDTSESKRFELSLSDINLADGEPTNTKHPLLYISFSIDNEF